MALKVCEKVAPELRMLESHSPVGAPGEPEVLLWPLLLQVHSTVSPGWIVTDEGENTKPPLPTMTVKVVALARRGQSATNRPMPSTARLIGCAPIALRKTFRKLTLRRNDRRDKIRGVEFADNGLDFRINVFLFPSIGGVWGTVVPIFLESGIRFQEVEFFWTKAYLVSSPNRRAAWMTMRMPKVMGLSRRRNPLRE